jgi:SAM-dependent methyltransferase
MPNWDTLYKDLIRDNGNDLWKEPHEYLVEFFGRQAKSTQPLRILDLGCGTGRHLIFLEELGYQTYGLDISPTGLAYSRGWLQKIGHPARVLLADMTSLPYTSSSFDRIISTYVIHHNTLACMRRTIKEIYRLLIPGGTTLISIPSMRGFRHDKGRQIEPGTVIPDIGQDNGIPHHYSDLKEVACEFAEFIIREIKLQEAMNDDGYLSSHWFIQAEKPKEIMT